MQIPSRLEPGDVIYLCAPAKKVDQGVIFTAEKLFQQLGYKTIVGVHASGENGYFSGTVEHRLYDLQKGLDHPDAKAVCCLRGGFGIVHLLNQINWKGFWQKPKWMMGFSDVTHLHLELQKMDFASLHCTMPLNFSENTQDSIRTMNEALQWQPLLINAPFSAFNLSGSVFKEITGGNLSVLFAHLHRLSPSFFNDKILFLEDVGEPYHHVDRMIQIMDDLGVFEKVAGVLFGSFSDMNGSRDHYGYSLEEILLRPLKNRAVPVAFQIPSGHQNDNQALVFGVKSELTVSETGTQISLNTQHEMV